jgi:hypothetical protein
MRTLSPETLTLRALGRDLARQDAALDATDPLRTPRTARGLDGWLSDDAELARICASARRRRTVEAAYRRQVAGAVR